MDYAGAATIWEKVLDVVPDNARAHTNLALELSSQGRLEDALEHFGGSAIIISHDRWFLDRVATHILAMEGDSAVVWYPGNYSEYEEDRRRRLGDAADRPHRITYRKLRRD